MGNVTRIKYRNWAPAAGITLIELIVGLSLTVTLSGMAIRGIARVTVRARMLGAKAMVESFATAQSMVVTGTGRYTTTLAELKQASVPEGFGSSWTGPYIVGISTQDPWNVPFFYASWYGGDAPTEWESQNLFYYATGGEVVLDSGPLIRETGSPLEVEYTFDVRPGTYVLKVINDGISSAWITVNGNGIVDPNDLRHSVTEVSAELTLTDSNTMNVRIASTPNASIRVTIETYDPPQLPPSELSEEEIGWHEVFGGSASAGFLLGSYGADREPGGSGINADIIYGMRD